MANPASNLAQFGQAVAGGAAPAGISQVQAAHMAGQMLQRMGSRGDTLLVHVNPKEFALLKRAGGSGTVNPKTGLYQFDSEGGGEGPGAEGGGNGPGMGASDSGGPSGQGGNGQGKSSTALGEEHNEEQSISDTSIGNQISNTAQSAKTAMQAMFAGINAPSFSGAAKGALVGALSGGVPGAIAGAFTGAAPGMPSISGALADHGVSTGNAPGVGQGQGGSSGYEGGGMFESPGLGGAPPVAAPSPANPALIRFAGQQINPAQIQPFSLFQPTPNPNLNMFGAQALR